MKYSSTLLWDLARGTDRSEPAAEDGALVVPPVLSPVVVVPAARRLTTGFDVNAIQRASFGTGSQVATPASTAETSNVVCTFGLGLWRVLISYAFICNTTQAFDALANNTLRLAGPDGVAQELVRALRVANVIHQYEKLYYWLLTEDSWILSIVNAATGVGVTQQSLVAVDASLLL